MAEHSDTPQSSSTATDESGTDEVAALRNQVATLQDRLKAANNRIEAWEQCMQRLVGCVLLGPDMNDMYKEEFSALLREALGSLEQIQEVHYVECSFPSVPSEAPHISLESWTSLDHSEWTIKWAPSWSMQVAVEGQQYYTQFKLLLRLFEFEVVGKLRVSASPSLSTIMLSFLQPPHVCFKTECSASASNWGAPLPLQTYIEAVVHEECRAWLSRNMVAPHEMVLKPASLQPKDGLTDEDLKKAIRAATVAQQFSMHTE